MDIWNFSCTDKTVELRELWSRGMRRLQNDASLRTVCSPYESAFSCSVC